jgi:YYY domain-containing protein
LTTAVSTSREEQAPPQPVATQTRSRGEALAVGLLLVILIIGAYFRFVGLNWDDNHHLHPDERFLTIVGSQLSSVDDPLDYLRTSVSTLNPYNFGQTFYVYGNLPMTVTRYVAEWTNALCERFGPDPGQSGPGSGGLCSMTYTAYDGIHLVGRLLSGLVDLASVLLTFFIGRRLYNWQAGLIAALLLALAVMPIQQSHFFTMDNWAAAFTTLGIYSAVRAATIGDAEPRWKLFWYGVFGLALGLAAASRVNIAPLAVIIGVSGIIWLARRGHTPRTVLRLDVNGDVQRVIIGVMLAGIASLLTFRFAQPYAFADQEMIRQQAIADTGEAPGFLSLTLRSLITPNPQFLSNMAEIQRLQEPEASFPPALQWTDRPALLFPFSNMVLYGMGITAGLFAWLAVIWAVWRMLRPGTRWGDYPEWMVHAIPVAWTLLYFLFMGTRWVKSVRYFLPIYPTLFIVAGWALVFLWQWALRREGVAERARQWRLAGMGLLSALIVVPSFLWALSFTQIYREPMTRIAASDWIFENVPTGATILYETAAGESRQLQLPVKGHYFEENGVPLWVDFALPEDGTITGVRLNYLSDSGADGDLADSESLWIALNDMAPVGQVLQLDETRQAVTVPLPPLTVEAGANQRLAIEAGPGGTVSAGTSILANEHWDDLLPVSTGGRNAYGAYYTEVNGGQRPVTFPDSPEKLEEVAAWLDEADYLMISSQRAMWHLPRLPLTYPMMMRYYESLFSGEMGFDLVAEFHGNLGVGPLRLSDTTAQVAWGQDPVVGWPPPSDLGAEEAFSVYDHPPVWIFAKTDRYSSETMRDILEGVDLSNVIVMNPLEATQAPDGLMLTPDAAARQQAGGTFDDVFAPDGLLSTNPWLAAVVWLLATVVLGWLAFPLTFVALGGLPDRGYALARVLGLLLLSYLPWLAASLGWLPHTRGTLLLALGIITALSAVVAYNRRHELIAFIRREWSYLVLVEVLGLVLFGLMIAIRLGNPDVWDVIWGGEKPMDLSYFTAVMKSTTMPPYDPWLAGGYINYYYYGFVFVGALAKLLGIVPAVAYNLALPMLYSFTGLAVFSLAHNLVRALDRERLGTALGDVGSAARSWSASLLSAVRQRATAAGLLAVLLALMLGNLAQTGVVANAWYLTGNPALDDVPLVGGAARTLDGGIKALTGTPAPIYPGDWFWNATRVIPVEEGEVGPITEFPFFTFLYGDLHAHMISMPLTMLALGWAMSLALLAVRRRDRSSRLWRAALEAALIGGVGALAIGALRATNTWDWPTYLLLGAVAVVYFVWRTAEAPDLRTAGRALLLVAGLAGLSLLLFWPFIAGYGTAYSSVSLWPGSYTPLSTYLLIYGLFLVFILTHLVREVRDWTASWRPEVMRSLEGLTAPLLVTLGLFVVLDIVLLARGYAIAPLVLPLLAVSGLLALRPGLETSRRIVLALMAAALGLTLMVEIIVLDGDIGRMNTVFKFYLQAWLLLSIACGVAAVWAWPALAARPRLRPIWGTAVAVLMAAALLYPLTATPAKWQIRMNPDAPNTLDGMAFMPYVEYGDTDYMGQSRTVRLAEDYDAIRWMQRNIEGSPVIAEAHGGNPYRSIANRVAMYTGLPAIVGWDWHQRQQRSVVPGSIVSNRIADVATLYNTADIAQAQAILDRYDVAYVFVGSLENTYYLPEGLAKFEQMAAAGLLTEVYRDDTARVFRVVRPDDAVAEANHAGQ